MLRSIGAVVAGFVFIAVTAIGADMALRSAMPGMFTASGRVEDTGALLFIQAYVALFAIAGCYLAARLAPSRPMQHALALGVLGLIFNIAGSAARWADVPVWYHVVAIAMVMPYAYIGGWLRVRQLERGDRTPTAAPA